MQCIFITLKQTFKMHISSAQVLGLISEFSANIYFLFHTYLFHFFSSISYLTVILSKSVKHFSAGICLFLELLLGSLGESNWLIQRMHEWCISLKSFWKVLNPLSLRLNRKHACTVNITVWSYPQKFLRCQNPCSTLWASHSLIKLLLLSMWNH